VRGALAFYALLLSCEAGGGARDAVPPSRDVVVHAAGPEANAQGYDYVARRPLAIVGLAEARGIEPQIARAAVDRIADALDACAGEQRRKGMPAAGAARLVVTVDGAGNVQGASARMDPSPGVAQSTALCLIAPTKRLTFPTADSGARGMAIEALWGQ
jgi:hypothetical protein